jgi:hypothetical protein
MSFADQLKSVRLRSTHRLTTKQVDQLLCPDSDTYSRMMKETQFECYYDAIRAWTFPSAILPLTDEQIDGLRDGHVMFKNSSLTNDENKLDECLQRYPSLITLCNNIDACQITRPMFVRLSTRSPKDALLHVNRETIRRLFQISLNEIPIDGTSGSMLVFHLSSID